MSCERRHGGCKKIMGGSGIFEVNLRSLGIVKHSQDLVTCTPFTQIESNVALKVLSGVWKLWKISLIGHLLHILSNFAWWLLFSRPPSQRDCPNLPRDDSRKVQSKNNTCHNSVCSGNTPFMWVMNLKTCMYVCNLSIKTSCPLRCLTHFTCSNTSLSAEAAEPLFGGERL